VTEAPAVEHAARLTEEGSVRLFGHPLYARWEHGLRGLVVRVWLRADGLAYTVRREWDGGLLGRMVSPACFEVEG
jgi:hypothetical protein